MDLFMNYEEYNPVHVDKALRKSDPVPFLVQQMSSAMYDTLAALDQLGHAKEHLSVIMVFEQSSSRDVKGRYMQAQACVREAMRFCEVLSLRTELVEFVSQAQSFGGIRRLRANYRNVALQYGTHLVAADAMLRKIVSAIGRDLSRATQASHLKLSTPVVSVVERQELQKPGLSAAEGA